MTIEINQPARSRTWYEIWLDVWTHPRAETFRSLLQESNHTPRRGFLWIAIVALLVAIITGYTSAQSFRSVEPAFGNIYIYFICLVVLTPIFTVIGMIISAGIYHWLARLFGGKGTWGDLVFCLSAAAAPSSVVAGIIFIASYLFSALGLSPLVIIISLISIGVAIYGFILIVFAVKAVENISTGSAVLTMLIPTIILGGLTICTVLSFIPLANFTR